ncbi:MAG: endonuclease III [Candidatus Thorarchaeota archaeon]|jgi:endonuclease-3
MSNTKIRKKAAKICTILINHYGDIIHPKKLPPIDELVLTILSQNTTDVNSQRAFENLKKLYSTWEEVLNAPQEKIADAIRMSGVFNVKAKRIHATLSEIKKRVGKLDISLLKDMELEKAKKWLTSLHGVGPKTAAIVLLFSFGRPTLPVDTHVWRVTKRIGLIPNKTSREKAHILLEKIIPTHCIYSLNYNLVRHGRKVCKAQKPQCENCILTKSCDYYNSRN